MNWLIFMQQIRAAYFTIENLSFNGHAATEVAYCKIVNNSGELILEEGIAAGTYSLDVRYEDNDGDIPPKDGPYLD